MEIAGEKQFIVHSRKTNRLNLHDPSNTIHPSKRTRGQPTGRILRIDPIIVRLLRHTLQT